MKNQVVSPFGLAVCGMLLLLSSQANAQEQAANSTTQLAPMTVTTPVYEAPQLPAPSLYPRVRGAIGATGAFQIMPQSYGGLGVGLYGELGAQLSDRFGVYAHLMASTILFSGAFSLTANAEWNPVPGLSLSAGAGIGGAYFVFLGAVSGLSATFPVGITGNIPLQRYQPGVRRTVLRIGARGGPLFGAPQGTPAAGGSAELQIGVGWL